MILLNTNIVSEFMRHKDAVADEPVSGLLVASIRRRVKAVVLGIDFSCHSRRVGLMHRMATKNAPTHPIIDQGH